MQKAELYESILSLFRQHPGNCLITRGQEAAMYEEPLIGIASAEDTLFSEYKKSSVIGPQHMSPCQWLPEAKSVLSLFFPISQEVRNSNRSPDGIPSAEWLYTRIEGQAFIADFTAALRDWFISQGIDVCVPLLDARLQQHIITTGENAFSDVSNWSERHAAYACGLGTFGLTKGLITEKGTAGRFSSLILDLPLEPTPRSYSGVYDYCSMCGACIRKCPVNAISLETGKNNAVCKSMVEETKRLYAPRYGCGKCQIGVPCEHKNPTRK